MFANVNFGIGGGIVFDSDPYEEFVETENKAASNTRTIARAEERYSNASSPRSDYAKQVTREKEPHIDLAAG